MGGRVPPIEEVAFKLRITEAKAGAILDDLVARGLLDEFEGVLRPHNWDGRQFVTDHSAASRMRNMRERKRSALRNDGVTSDVPRLQITETDSERKKDIRS